MRLLHVSDWHLGSHATGHTARRETRRPCSSRPSRSRASSSPTSSSTPATCSTGPGPRSTTSQLATATRCGSSPRSRRSSVLAGNHDSPELLRFLGRLARPGPHSLRRQSSSTRTTAASSTSRHAERQRIRLAPLPFVPRTGWSRTFEDPSTWTAATPTASARSRRARRRPAEGSQRAATCCSSPRTCTSPARTSRARAAATRLRRLRATRPSSRRLLRRVRPHPPRQSAPASLGHRPLRRLADPARLRRGARPKGLRCWSRPTPAARRS